MLSGSFLHDCFFLVFASLLLSLCWRTVDWIQGFVTKSKQLLPAALPEADMDGTGKEEEENQDQEDEEEEDGDAWKQAALTLARGMVGSSDPLATQQSMDQLFQVMVSMGVVEFTTEGYTFKLTRHVDVIKIVE